LKGTFNESLVLNAQQTTLEENMKHYSDWGGPDAYPHYHAGWSMAGNTPFKYCKQIVHNGGVSDPLIINWPKGIKPKAEVRNQYAFITDLMAAAPRGHRHPVHGRNRWRQTASIDGKSLLYSFDTPPRRRRAPSSTANNWAVARCTKMDGRR
jgi:arylsulfatase A-like enzyme